MSLSLYQILLIVGLALSLCGVLTLSRGVFILDEYVFEQLQPDDITAQTFEARSNQDLSVTRRIMFTAAERAARRTKVAIITSMVLLVTGFLVQITAILIFQ